MKYFLDTEFIEGFKSSYYKLPISFKNRHFIDLISIGVYCEDGRSYYAISNEFNPKDADDWVKKNVIDKLEQKATSFYDSPRLRQNNLLYKSNRIIAQDLLEFFGCEYQDGFWAAPSGIEVYGYYADYDWVLFCSLFGRMIDLPNGFPMYCKDLKQMMDERGLTKEWKQKYCPDPEGEHNALVDAKWNYELYKNICSAFLTFEKQ
jgi:hypothetical protein